MKNIEFRAFVNGQFIDPIYMDGIFYVDEEFREIIENPELLYGYDVNGDPVFEGDTVDIYHEEVPGSIANGHLLASDSIVEFIDGSFCFRCIEGKVRVLGFYETKSIVLTGNIHQHKKG